MTRFTTFGRICFAVALFAFGVEQFIYGDFVAGRAPAWPASVPGRLAWAYGSGVVFMIAAVAIATARRLWLAGIVTGTTIFLWALIRQLPEVATDPTVGIAWTKAGKALTLFGGAYAIAALDDDRWREQLVRLGRFCLGAFLGLGGVQHFLFPEFVATLVPAWIPGQLFWTYFAGVALISGGVGLMLPWTARLAAMLSGLMVFAWFLILHIPRALVAAPGAASQNEWTAVFESLAVAGIAFLLAGLVKPTAEPEASAVSGAKALEIVAD